MSADSSDSPSPEEENISLSELNARLKSLSTKEEPGAENGEPEEQEEEEDLRSEKEKEIERLRAAEKFIEVDEGKYECLACSYVYDPAAGEPRNGIPADTPFENLSASYVCPSCRSPKSRFVSRKKIIAGFAENQRYGFGSNGLTGGEKNFLIFGGLVLCALILLSGYALN